MRLSISRWTLVIAASVGLAVMSASGCRTAGSGSGFSMPGAAWLGMGQKKSSALATKPNYPVPPGANGTPTPTAQLASNAGATYPTRPNTGYGATAGVSPYGAPQGAAAGAAGGYHTGPYSTGSTAGAYGGMAEQNQPAGYSTIYPPSGSSYGAASYGGAQPAGGSGVMPAYGGGYPGAAPTGGYGQGGYGSPTGATPGAAAGQSWNYPQTGGYPAGTSPSTGYGSSAGAGGATGGATSGYGATGYGSSSYGPGGHGAHSGSSSPSSASSYGGGSGYGYGGTAQPAAGQGQPSAYGSSPSTYGTPTTGGQSPYQGSSHQHEPAASSYGSYTATGSQPAGSEYRPGSTSRNAEYLAGGSDGVQRTGYMNTRQADASASSGATAPQDSYYGAGAPSGAGTSSEGGYGGYGQYSPSVYR